MGWTVTFFPIQENGSGGFCYPYHPPAPHTPLIDHGFLIRWRHILWKAHAPEAGASLVGWYDIRCYATRNSYVGKTSVWKVLRACQICLNLMSKSMVTLLLCWSCVKIIFEPHVVQTMPKYLSEKSKLSTIVSPISPKSEKNGKALTMGASTTWPPRFLLGVWISILHQIKS